MQLWRLPWRNWCIHWKYRRIGMLWKKPVAQCYNNLYLDITRILEWCKLLEKQQIEFFKLELYGILLLDFQKNLFTAQDNRRLQWDQVANSSINTNKDYAHNLLPASDEKWPSPAVDVCNSAQARLGLTILTYSGRVWAQYHVHTAHLGQTRAYSLPTLYLTI